jgi:hypothetical protein
MGWVTAMRLSYSDALGVDAMGWVTAMRLSYSDALGVDAMGWVTATCLEPQRRAWAARRQ